MSEQEIHFDGHTQETETPVFYGALDRVSTLKGDLLSLREMSSQSVVIKLAAVTEKLMQLTDEDSDLNLELNEAYMRLKKDSEDRDVALRALQAIEENIRRQEAERDDARDQLNKMPKEEQDIIERLSTELSSEEREKFNKDYETLITRRDIYTSTIRKSLTVLPLLHDKYKEIAPGLREEIAHLNESIVAYEAIVTKHEDEVKDIAEQLQTLTASADLLEGKVDNKLSQPMSLRRVMSAEKKMTEEFEYAAQETPAPLYQAMRWSAPEGVVVNEAEFDSRDNLSENVLDPAHFLPQESFYSIPLESSPVDIPPPLPPYSYTNLLDELSQAPKASIK